MASIEPREAGQVRRNDIVTILDGTRRFDVIRVEQYDGEMVARIWPCDANEGEDIRGQWIGASLLRPVCPEPARRAGEQDEHDAHCCECGTTADHVGYVSRGGYRRCNPCDTTHVRTLAFTSSGRALPIDWRRR